MKELTPEETIALFAKHWYSREPDFRLDEEFVRHEIAVVVSGMMSLLAVAPPEVWDRFMLETGALAKRLVPLDVQEKIKNASS